MMVKMSQWKNLSGSKGPWKSFLASVVKDSPSFQIDPAKQPWYVLAAFLATMRDSDTKMFKNFQEFLNYNHSIELLEKTQPFPVTPEEELVQITRAHSRFKQDYKFESYNEGWVRTERGEPGNISSPERLIGLDCEMVECKDGTREVVRVCAVDRNLMTLIDTLVLPSKSVSEYKSHITGVSEEDLKSVTVTQSDVQKQVIGLLLPGTIVVGHSVHNDLKALKINHRRVIDTQFIFPIRNRPQLFAPSLRDLCKAVLDYDFREDGKPHNCVDDAQVPMKLVQRHLEHGPSVLSIPYEVDESYLSKLLLHKVPTDAKTTDLQSLFSKFPCEIQNAAKDVKKYSVYTSKYAAFKDKADADAAFALLQGFRSVDITGRAQKKVGVSLKGQYGYRKAEVVVRKMGFGSSDGTSKPPNCFVETTAKTSKQTQGCLAGKKGVPETVDNTKQIRNLTALKSCSNGDVETVEAENVENSDMGEGGMAGADEFVRKPKRSRREGSEDNIRLSISKKRVALARNEDAQTSASEDSISLSISKKRVTLARDEDAQISASDGKLKAKKKEKKRRTKVAK